MKFAAALSVLAVVVLATVQVDADGKDVPAALKECAANSNLSTDQLNKACEGKLPEAETELRAYKCFARCVQERVGIMGADGKVNPERSRSLVEPSQQETMRIIAEKCQGEGVEDLCEKAFTVDSCYAKENQTMYEANCKGLIKIST